VTVGELTKWTLVGTGRLGTWPPCERSFRLSQLLVLPYDQRVAAQWGELQASGQLRGRPQPVNDSWIAACCLVRDLPLATFNAKDFEAFAEHDGLTLALR
jgi:predicted nucleic acid-binding protein